MRVPFDQMKATIEAAFVKAGMSREKAATCAQVHTESSCDGVPSHGLNRVERFVEYLHKGWVDPDAEPSLEKSLGAMEVYNGNLGPGILNATFAMTRAAELARSGGFAIVGLRNTTHWMRGGAYGWLAADKGCIGICWTNTEAVMPPWGAKSEAIGNNPFVMAVPRREGHVVLDMAMSQYSYGKLSVTRLKGAQLPYAGGFDEAGNLTTDPGAIEATRRILPMGFWKGSGFAVMLDLTAALLCGGLNTPGIDSAGKGSCGGCSQVFIAADPAQTGAAEQVETIIRTTLEQVTRAVPAREGDEVRYPGEQSLRARIENMRSGIPVDEGVWSRVKELAS